MGAGQGYRQRQGGRAGAGRAEWDEAERGRVGQQQGNGRRGAGLASPIISRIQ